jgi:hypothetical protein
MAKVNHLIHRPIHFIVLNPTPLPLRGISSGGGENIQIKAEFFPPLGGNTKGVHLNVHKSS